MACVQPLSLSVQLNLVALLKDYREEKLLRGQIGAVVESYGDGEFEVEFADKQGRTINVI